MKESGIVRKIDNLGRLVIPKELRKTFGMDNGDLAEFFQQDNFICIKKYETGCTICNGEVDLINFKEKLICKKCAHEVAGRG